MARKTQKAKRYLTVTQVQERYGNVSKMWVERRLKADEEFRNCFTKFGRLRMADEDKLEAWERACAASR
jgi:hypothetical protein